MEFYGNPNETFFRIPLASAAKATHSTTARTDTKQTKALHSK
jgi:hypothetical protein